MQPQIFKTLDGKFISYSDGKAVVLDKAEITKNEEERTANANTIVELATEKIAVDAKYPLKVKQLLEEYNYQKDALISQLNTRNAQLATVINELKAL